MPGLGLGGNYVLVSPPPPPPPHTLFFENLDKVELIAWKEEKWYTGICFETKKNIFS